MANAQISPPIMVLPDAWQDDPQLVGLFAQIADTLSELYTDAFWSFTETDADYTTSSTTANHIRREFIICTNTSAITVSLHDGSASNEPREGDEVMIVQASTGLVKVDPGDKTLNGSGNIDGLGGKGGRLYIYNDISAEWFSHP